jgi:hypothetical protein
MSQMMATNVGELLPSRPCELYGLHSRPADSRTPLKKYFLDPVLPVLTLLSMSVLTIVMLVMLVTTVADMDLRLPDSYVSIDPATGVYLGAAGGSYQDQGAYAGFSAAPEPLERLDSWSGPRINDPLPEPVTE